MSGSSASPAKVKSSMYTSVSEVIREGLLRIKNPVL